MIEMSVLSAPFACRTKDLLWYRETRQCISLLRDGQSLQEIKKMGEEENIFNASSASRADNIRVVLARRIRAVNDRFLEFFESQDTMTQKQLCIVLVMLTELANTLQVCADCGAKKVLIPAVSMVEFATVPPDLMSAFQLIPYQSAEDAVFKVLGVE